MIKVFLYLGIGFFIGGCIGYFIAALMAAASHGDSDKRDFVNIMDEE